MPDRIKNFLLEQKIILLIFFIGLVLYFVIPDFLSFKNIVQIFLRVSIEGIIIIGMAYLIILGEIDLSVGQIMSLSAVVCVFLQDYGSNMTGSILAILGGIATGLVIGLLNGLIVVKLKIPSIASTLGMLVLLNGIVYILTRSDSIYGSNENFQLIADSLIFRIPVILIVLLVLVVVFDLILRKTTWGRDIFAIGNNPIAAQYAGINVDRVKINAFVLTGALSGLAGAFLVSRFNVASGLLGTTTNIFVITGVLLGGVSLKGGEGSVYKAFQGLILIGIIENAVINVGAHSAIKTIIMGTLLIIMLSLDGVYVRKSQFI